MSRRKRIYLLTLAALCCGFLVLTAFIGYKPLPVIDLDFSRSVQAHRNTGIDRLMHVISIPGSSPYCFLLVPAATAVFLFLRLKREAKYVFLTSVAGLMSWSLKLLVNRPRPAGNLVTVMTHAKNQSFPSGHVLFYVAFFGMLIIIMTAKDYFAGWIRVTVASLSALYIFLVPLSRIYLGAHWFTDVTAGFLAGLFCLSVLAWFYLFRRWEG